MRIHATVRAANDLQRLCHRHYVDVSITRLAYRQARARGFKRLVTIEGYITPPLHHKIIGRQTADQLRIV